MKNEVWHRIEFRLNDNLYKRLNFLCKKYNCSKAYYLRNMIDFCTAKKLSDSLIVKDNLYKKQLMYQVHCYGNNLNQIAHKLNIAIKSDKLLATDLIDLKSAIKDVEHMRKWAIELESYIHNRM